MEVYAELTHQHTAVQEDIERLKERLVHAEEKLDALVVHQTEEIRDFRKILDSEESMQKHFAELYTQNREELETTPPWKWNILLPFHRDAHKDEHRATVPTRAVSKVTRVGKRVGQWYHTPSRKNMLSETRAPTINEIRHEIAELKKEKHTLQQKIAETKELYHSGGYMQKLTAVRDKYRVEAVGHLYEILEREDAPVSHLSGKLYTAKEVQAENQRIFKYGESRKQ